MPALRERAGAALVSTVGDVLCEQAGRNPRQAGDQLPEGRSFGRHELITSPLGAGGLVAAETGGVVMESRQPLPRHNLP